MAASVDKSDARSLHGFGAPAQASRGRGPACQMARCMDGHRRSHAENDVAYESDQGWSDAGSCTGTPVATDSRTSSVGSRHDPRQDVGELVDDTRLRDGR
jgi:hypothetical protein